MTPRSRPAIRLCAVALAMCLLTTPVPLAAQGARPAHPATITGSAWHADNTPIGGARLRLRNADTGQLRAAQVADHEGRFVFAGIESGTFVIELVSGSGKVLATGTTLAVGPADTIVTFIRLGSRSPWFAGFFTNAAAVVAATAAAAGVTAIAADEMRPASARR